MNCFTKCTLMVSNRQSNCRAPENPSLVYIQNYFDTNYVPNNMGIFISGDIDIEATINLIADKFGHWERKRPRSRPLARAAFAGRRAAHGSVSG